MATEPSDQERAELPGCSREYMEWLESENARLYARVRELSTIYESPDADLPTLRSLQGVLKDCLPEGVDSVEFVRLLRDRKDPYSSQ